jgi:hypothetical protein
MSAIMDTTPGHIRLLTSTANQVIVTMPHHLWHASVNRALPLLDKIVADNELTVTTQQFTHVPAGRYDEATFRATYAIHPQP